jgi:hypothetical protein
VLISTLIAVALTAALAGFATSTLPQAVTRQLAQSVHTTVAVSGAFSGQVATADATAVPAALHEAFGKVPVLVEHAIWSDPLGLPTRRGATVVPLLVAAAPDQITANAVLQSGSWPGSLRQGGAIPVALPVSVGAALHLVPGDQVALRDRLSGQRVSIRVTGLYRPRDPGALYWELDLIPTSGINAQAGFITYGPAVADPALFGPHGLAVGGASWLAFPETSRIRYGDLTRLATRIRRMESAFGTSPAYGGLAVSTGLLPLLVGLAENVQVARSLLIIGVLELLLLAGAALVLTARTLASQREDEAAVMTARGAGRSQLARLAAAEVSLILITAGVVGVLAGNWLASLLASTGPLRAAALHVAGISAADVLAVGLVLVVCAGVTLWPAFRPLSAASARVRRGRRAAVSTVAQASGDVAIVLLAVLVGWQLRKYAAVSHTVSGVPGVDPVLVLAPALALAAGAVMSLRLMPLLARAIEGLAARTSRLGAAMASWEISRRAVQQSACVLLVVLAVGTGTLALAQHQSWRTSAGDQAAFAVGSDIRLDLPTPLPIGRTGAVTRAPGVTAAMAVSNSQILPNGNLLAISANRAHSAALLRADQSVIPPAALWRGLWLGQRAPVFVLPGRPARLQLTASLDPGRGQQLGAAQLSLSVQDANGIVYQVPAGTLPDDGRSHQLVAALSPSREATYPLALLGISASFHMPLPPLSQLLNPKSLLNTAPTLVSFGNQPAAFRVTRLAVSAAASGPFAAAFSPGVLNSWRARVTSDSGAVGPPASLTAAPRQTSGAAIVTFLPGAGALPITDTANYTFAAESVSLTVPMPVSILPAIATQAFMSSNKLSTGDVIPISFGQIKILVRIVAVVGNFPTVTGTAGALIVDLAALQDLVANRGGGPVQVTQWWLRSTANAVPRGLPRGTVVTDRARMLQSMLRDPLSAIPQQAVQAIALAAALIAVLGFSVSIASNVRERRAQSALLAALGVTRGAQARLLCLEALTLSLPSAAVGVLLGALIAGLLVPAVTLTSAAAAPVPPVLVQVPLPQVLGLALIVAAMPVMAAAASVAYRPDPAAQLRIAEAT